MVLARSLQLGDEWQVLAGLAALAGHIWPLWLGWKGGKAVATGLGMLLGLSWPVGLACFGVFVTVISFSRIVSLASVSAAISLPLLMLWSFVGSSFRPAYLVLALIAMVLVVWRHRSNLKRLLAGSEPKLGQPR
ncbi:MAG: Glycerol-3-phosphate acyltransferase [Prochlorococcus marinus str. MIT 9215]|nr:MAG: Glycerol-3-phosphate acyltransferase [Prochlorococcus marinus str. MIT 9215]